MHLQRRIVRESCFLGFAAAFAYYYAFLRTRLPVWEPAGFDAVLSGSAPTPFQYRGLFPWIYRAVQESGVHLPFMGTTGAYCFTVEAAATFGLLLSFRYYLSRFLPSAVAPALTLSVALVLPFHYLIPRIGSFYYVYDTPSVLFMTLGLALLCERRWALFYPMFALATLNRETTCFLTLAYLLNALGKERYPRIAAHALAQAAIWTGIKLHLMHLFGDNSGGLFWYRLEFNLNALARPHHVAQLLSSLGYTWVFVIPFWHRIESRFVRRTTLVAPFHFLAMFLVGKVSEVRVFGEMIPVVLPAFLLVICAALKREPEQSRS